MDFYGENFSYIHLKFGDARKMFFFTEELRAKHPNFCKEYEKYWDYDPTCRFNSPLEIAQYVDLFNIPVKFYFNFTDREPEDMAEVYSYFIREYIGITKNEDGSYRSGFKGLDDEEPSGSDYKVIKVRS